MEVPVALLILFSACFANKDMSNKAFIFPFGSQSDYVSVKTSIEKPLEKLTVCLSSYTDLERPHALFSLAEPGPGKDNAFLIFPKPPNVCQIYINQEAVDFVVDREVLEWKETCVTYDSTTGMVQLYINGKAYPRKGVRNKQPIGPKVSIILGQEQDKFEGGFEDNQSFTGEISRVNMWDSVLSNEEMLNTGQCGFCMTGNVINWNDLEYSKSGSVW